jgi:hypothetical protein
MTSPHRNFDIQVRVSRTERATRRLAELQVGDHQTIVQSYAAIERSRSLLQLQLGRRPALGDRNCQQSQYGASGTAVVSSWHSTAVPSETAETAPTQRDGHLHCIAEHGRAAWQKASG